MLERAKKTAAGEAFSRATSVSHGGFPGPISVDGTAFISEYRMNINRTTKVNAAVIH